MSRRNRRNRQEQPEQTAAAPASAPATIPSADELRALRERLDRVEAVQEVAWYPGKDIVEANQKRLAENIRDGGGDCPACGVADGERRRIGNGSFAWSSAWMCVPCTEAVEPGWGTSIRHGLPREAGLDRLACLAAGLDDPTPDLRDLAARYGLDFRLAQDSGEGDGTPWSHLDREKWHEVGVKAVRRAAAGFAGLPANALLADRHVPMTTGWVMDLTHPLGRRWGPVPAPVEMPSAEERAAQLRAEEEAVDAALKAQAQDRIRAEKEEAARVERERQEEELEAHYRVHMARLDAQIRAARQALRDDRDRARARIAHGGL